MVCQNFDGYLGVMSDFVRYPQEIESVVLNQHLLFQPCSIPYRLVIRSF